VSRAVHDLDVLSSLWVEAGIPCFFHPELNEVEGWDKAASSAE